MFFKSILLVGELQIFARAELDIFVMTLYDVDLFRALKWGQKQNTGNRGPAPPCSVKLQRVEGYCCYHCCYCYGGKQSQLSWSLTKMS